MEMLKTICAKQFISCQLMNVLIKYPFALEPGIVCQKMNFLDKVIGIHFCPKFPRPTLHFNVVIVVDI